MWRRRRLCLCGTTLLLLAGCSVMETAGDDAPVRPANDPPAAAVSLAQYVSQSEPQTVTARYAPAAADLPACTPRHSGWKKTTPKTVAVPASEIKTPFDGVDLLSVPRYATGTVELVAAQDAELPAGNRTDAEDSVPEPDPQTPLPAPEAPPADRYPIDLATAMQLAGANNLQIALAAERVREAAAHLDRAEVLWVPTFDVGLGYNRHDGQIQDTRGQVIEVSRQSAFVVGGPRVGDAPLTGLSGGPARLFLGGNPAVAYFAPLAARQATRAASAETAATFNDTLRDVGLRYYELVSAQMRMAIAREAVANAARLVELTRSFVEAGAGLAADVARARAQLAEARVELYGAEQDLRVTSAELARLLRLDPAVTLYPAETAPLPVTLVPTEIPLPELIAQSLSARPELARQQALAAAAEARWRQEKWRPWVPNLYLATSAGGYGGGPNDFFGNFEGRNDFDALAVWSFENLGLGNQARQREQASRPRQEVLEFQRVHDRVAAEVAQAYYRAQLALRQIEEAQELVAAAAEALPLNFRGIRGGELRPIEAQQAIRQLADARRRYLAAVIEYDQAQLELLRAIGKPPEPHAAFAPPVETAVPAMLAPPPTPVPAPPTEEPRPTPQEPLRFPLK